MLTLKTGHNMFFLCFIGNLFTLMKIMNTDFIVFEDQ